MDLSEDDEVLLNHWQTLHFASQRKDVDISTHVDAKRAALFLINGLKARAAIEEDQGTSSHDNDWIYILNDVVDSYQSLVDSNPVNSYVEQVALHLGPHAADAIKIGPIDVQSSLGWKDILSIHPFLEQPKVNRNTASSKRSLPTGSPHMMIDTGVNPNATYKSSHPTRQPVSVPAPTISSAAQQTTSTTNTSGQGQIIPRRTTIQTSLTSSSSPHITASEGVREEGILHTARGFTSTTSEDRARVDDMEQDRTIYQSDRKLIEIDDAGNDMEATAIKNTEHVNTGRRNSEGENSVTNNNGFNQINKASKKNLLNTYGKHSPHVSGGYPNKSAGFKSVQGPSSTLSTQNCNNINNQTSIKGECQGNASTNNTVLGVNYYSGSVYNNTSTSGGNAYKKQFNYVRPSIPDGYAPGNGVHSSTRSHSNNAQSETTHNHTNNQTNITSQSNTNTNGKPMVPSFKTAAMVHLANIKKGTVQAHHAQQSNIIATTSTNKRTLGGKRSGSVNSRFVSPLIRNDTNNNTDDSSNAHSNTNNNNSGNMETGDGEVDERLKGLDPKIVEMVTSEIMDHGPSIEWDDIAGLKHAKKTIMEIVVWPLLRPDIFHGLRGPPKGILLFGPPGTGKTMIGKCIASQSGATFFSISASSLTSKWVGEGEKMVRALFAVARIHQPSVIFVDEIDSLLSARNSGEHESSRRIKTEFLVQLDGAATSAEDRILLVGATNLPQEIDDAARRRMVKRLYIPLPDEEGRKQLFDIVLSKQAHSLTQEELRVLVGKTEGYSGSDISNLCKEAALGPIRTIVDIRSISADQVRPINFHDFEEALSQVRASVSQDELALYVQWNKDFGSLAM
eukprot:CFRG4400T1